MLARRRDPSGFAGLFVSEHVIAESPNQSRTIQRNLFDLLALVSRLSQKIPSFVDVLLRRFDVLRVTGLEVDRPSLWARVLVSPMIRQGLPSASATGSLLAFVPGERRPGKCRPGLRPRKAAARFRLAGNARSVSSSRVQSDGHAMRRGGAYPSIRLGLVHRHVAAHASPDRSICRSIGCSNCPVGSRQKHDRRFEALHLVQVHQPDDRRRRRPHGDAVVLLVRRRPGLRGIRPGPASRAARARRIRTSSKTFARLPARTSPPGAATARAKSPRSSAIFSMLADGGST